MDFLLNISDEDFIINKVYHFLSDDDLTYTQKDFLNFSSENLGQSSFGGWSPLPILIGRADHNHQNPIPFIPEQNFNILNQNLVTTQKILVCNPPIAEIPSQYPFVDIDSYSRTNDFEESMNNITNINKSYMAYNTPISVEPKGISDIFYDFEKNIMWDDTTYGYEPTLDNFMGESHPSDDLLVNEGTKSTSREHQGQVMIQTGQEKNKKLVRRSKPSKKAKTIKRKWTQDQDLKLGILVELYGTKKWGKIAKSFEGREGKQCRERWYNYLRPNIKRGAWTEEEDQIFIEAHKIAGNKWTEIAQMLPGRSENAIKNRWNATKRRMQLMKTKQSEENENPPRNVILENYINDVTINNDPPMAIETENANNDATEPVVEVASTTSCYVPEPATISLDDIDIAELLESIDDLEMLLMQR